MLQRVLRSYKAGRDADLAIREVLAVHAPVANAEDLRVAAVARRPMWRASEVLLAGPASGHVHGKEDVRDVVLPADEGVAETGHAVVEIIADRAPVTNA